MGSDSERHLTELAIANCIDPLLASEAYQHGRTLGRLEQAREALSRIASQKQVRNLRQARETAEIALELTKDAKPCGVRMFRFQVSRLCAAAPPTERAAIARSRPELFPFEVTVHQESTQDCPHCGTAKHRIHGPCRRGVERAFNLPAADLDGPRYICESMGEFV